MAPVAVGTVEMAELQMHRRGEESVGQAPDVQVMHVEDMRVAQDVGTHRRDVQARRGCLQQHP